MAITSTFIFIISQIHLEFHNRVSPTRYLKEGEETDANAKSLPMFFLSPIRSGLAGIKVLWSVSDSTLECK